MPTDKGFFARLKESVATPPEVELGVAQAEPEAKFVRFPSDVPSFYADTCMYVQGIGGTVRMQFVEVVPGARDSTDPGLKMRYAFNLIIPHEGFVGMVQYMLSVLSEDDRKAVIDGI
jgi:hypothetical protein